MFENLYTEIDKSDRFSEEAKCKIGEILIHRFESNADLWLMEDIEAVFTEYVTPGEIDKFVEIYGAYYSKDINEILKHLRNDGVVRSANELIVLDGDVFTRAILIEKKDIENAIARQNIEYSYGII